MTVCACSGTTTLAHGVTAGPVSKAGASGGSVSGKPVAGGGSTAVAAGPCHGTAFVQHAGLATGALHAYLDTPNATGALSPGANGRAAALSKAALAVAFAQGQLHRATAAMKNCPTAKALIGVAQQNELNLARLGRSLRAGSVTSAQVISAQALLADFVAQAKRLDVTVIRKLPTAAQLRA